MKRNLFGAALSVACLVFYSAAYQVDRADLNAIDLDSRPQVVTNVTFDGLALLADVPAIASNVVASYDTAYALVTGVTNANQTIQFVRVTNETPSILEIKLPETDGAADWLMYVVSETNVLVRLPPARWWMARSSVTNEVPGQTPTAFYFSQITDGIFSVGRLKMEEIVIPESETRK